MDSKTLNQMIAATVIGGVITLGIAVALSAVGFESLAQTYLVLCAVSTLVMWVVWLGTPRRQGSGPSHPDMARREEYGAEPDYGDADEGGLMAQLV